MHSERFDTILAHDEACDLHDGIAPTIHQTSLFTFKSFEEMRAAVAGESDRFIYTRGRNPTVRAFEQKVAQLEHAADARAFSSGMGAISAAVLSNIKAGDRIVCVRNVYPDAYKLFTQFLPRFGVTTNFVDGANTDEVIASLDGARLLYLESPTSLMFELQDIPALARAAKEHGALTIVDNSWATPLNLKPLTLGADLVVHSASKYLCGHSDVVAGIVLGSKEAITQLSASELMILGAKLAPLEAWLLLRGLRTLSVRLERHRRSAIAVASFLSAHPAVTDVHYPELPSHPQHALFRQQYRGANGLLSFQLRDSLSVRSFTDAVRLFQLGVSWGGFESLIYPVAVGYAASSTASNEPSSLRAFAVPENLVRLHIGLEDPNDLISDLDQAFARC